MAAIKLDRPSRPVHLSARHVDRAADYVQMGSGGKSSAHTHPFARMIDFWVMAAAYAVFLGLDPVDEPASDSFVRISTNPSEGPSLPDEIQTTLIALHVADNQDIPIDDIDLSPSAILRTADRYAESGAPALLDRLHDHLTNMDVLPYQGMANMLVEDHETAAPLLSDIIS